MEEKGAPHVLIFPFPAQGHINQMLKLAELICLSGIQVTFLNTEHNHHRLLQFTDVQSRFARFAGFRLESISDGAPADQPRPSGFILDFSKLFNMKTIMSPDLRRLLLSSGDKPGWSPITCIICDGIMTFAIDVGKELGIQTIAFRTTSTCYFWALFCLPKLIETGQIPYQDDADMDEKVLTVPGMEDFFFRRRDLPSFFHVRETSDPALQFFVNETFNSTRASALILNTNEDLEGPFLSQIRTKFQKVYTLGSLHSLLKNLRITSTGRTDSSSSNNNGLWEEDRSCLTWLDSQPLKSVLYVSFGSVTVLKKTQLLEFWHGLVNTGYPFLWVRRPESVTGDDEAESQIPAELREGTKKRGFIVKWAPQEEVLAHRAVGGFLTHSGWNSTLESMVARVPMICWPHQVDQQMNSRLVGEVWKIGVDMKDRCDRSTVEKMVRDVMDGDKREEMMRSTAEMADSVKKSVSEGGSSYCNLETLVQDLRSGFQVNNKVVGY